MQRDNEYSEWVHTVVGDVGARPSGHQVTIVLPMQEEQAHVGKLLGRIGRFLKNAPWSGELIVVDDGSEDGTGESAIRWKSYVPAISVVRHARPQGRGTAVRTGVLLASGSYVVVVDPRGETPIEDSVSLIENLEQGADVAIASRRMPGSESTSSASMLERVSETTFMALSKLLVPLSVRDVAPELLAMGKAASRRIAQRARVAGDAWSLEWLAVAHHLGAQVAEVPVSWLGDAEDGGHRRLNEVTMLRDVWRLRARLAKEEGLKAKATHQLLHETNFVRVDRKELVKRESPHRSR